MAVDKTRTHLSILHFPVTKEAAIGPASPLPSHWTPFYEGATAVGGRAARAAAAASARSFVRIVRAVNALEAGLAGLSDGDLAARTPALRARLAVGASLDSVLPEAFAVVREASRRVLGLRHFDVQLMGGAVLHAGCVAEMRTGEGKTLVALLPAYLHALPPSAGAVHVVTVNDYLAVRDRAWVGRVLEFLGVAVDVATAATPHADLRRVLSARVVWATAQTLAFAYLRDNSAAFAPDDVALVRPLALAIVDEADSILIDECRSPMIISGAADAGGGEDGDGGEGGDRAHAASPPSSRYTLAQAAIAPLRGLDLDPSAGEDGGGRAAALAAAEAAGADFTVDRRRQTVALTRRGAAAVVGRLFPRASPASPASLWGGPDPWGPYITNALKANTLYSRDVQYLVRDGEARVIDLATGRVMPRARWTDGIHQAVEAKEGLAVRPPTVTQGSITFQSFFRFYGTLAGMTGTAAGEAEELGLVYNLDVIPIPPHRPPRRVDHPPSVYFRRAGKDAMLALLVRRAQAGGRPLLIGTRSVEESDGVSALLAGGLAGAHADVASRYPGAFPPDPRTGRAPPFIPVPHCVLNARPEAVAAEARIVAQAGLPGAVTVATNMAGRGTDILLGGNARGLALDALARALGGLLEPGGGEGVGGEGVEGGDEDAAGWADSLGAPARRRSAAWPAADALPLPAAAARPPPVGVYGALKRAEAVLRVAGPPPKSPGAPDSVSPRTSPEEAGDAPPGAGVVEAELERAMAAAETLRSRLVLEAARAGLPPLVGDLEGETAEEAFGRAYPAAAALVDGEVWGAGEGGGGGASPFTPTVASPRAALTAAALITWLWFDCLTARLGAGVRARGGLIVVCASILDTQRSVDQLLGRCGRQGDPGEAWVVVSTDDAAPEAGLVVGVGSDAAKSLPPSAPGFTASAWADALASAAGLAPEDEYAPPAVSRMFLRAVMRRVEAHASGSRMELKAFDGVLGPLRGHMYALRRLVVAGGAGARAAAVAALLRDAGADLVAAHCEVRVRPPKARPGTPWEDTPGWRVGAAVCAARALVDGPAAGVRPGGEGGAGAPVLLPLDDPRRPRRRAGLAGAVTLVYGPTYAHDAPALAAAAVSAAARGRTVLFGFGTVGAGGLFSEGGALDDPPEASAVAAALMRAAAAAISPPNPATHTGAAALAAAGGPGARTAGALAVALGDALVAAYADARRPAIAAAFTAHAAAWEAQGRALPPWMVDVAYAPASTGLWEKEALLGALDDAWVDFLVDARALEGAASLRSYARLGPLDEFRLEAGARFKGLLVEWRAAAAGALFAGPELEVGPVPPA